MSTSGFNLECISEFCSGLSSQDAPKILAKGIRSGNTDLLSIVQALGLYLTSSAVDQRCQGTRLLSEVLSHLHTHQLPQDDVHYLASFYCDRLKDRATILPYVLRGLHAMVIQQSIVSDDVLVISRAIFSEVYNQSLPQGERRLVYIIMDYFLTEHIEALKMIGSEFVLGYIQAMDGEKDPRNLVIVFNSVQRIIQHLPFEVLAEDLFEVTSCYFPIDFTPPPDDPYAISKDELVIALRKCLTASHKFAEFCLPLMLEKVSSDLLSAKLDALLTIAAGCQTFGTRGLEKYLEALWIAIRREIFQCVSQDVEAAGIQCLEEMSKALSPLPLSSSTSGNIRELTEMALKDCSRHLVEPELRLLSPASHILLAVAGGCEQACLAISAPTIPLLLEQYHNRSSVNQKKAVLEVLLKFIIILKHFRREDAQAALDKHKNELITLVVSLITCSTDHSLVLVGLSICQEILSISHYLDENNEVILLIEHMKQVALTHGDVSVKKRACGTIECVALSYPHVIKESILPQLMKLFTLNTSVESNARSILDVGSVLVSISASSEFQATILTTFIDLLEQLADQSSPTPHHEVDLAEGLVNRLSRAVEKTVTLQMTLGSKVAYDTVVKRLLRLCIVPSLKSAQTPTRHLFLEEDVLSQCLSLFQIFTQTANNLGECWFSLIHEILLDSSKSSSFLPQHSTSFQPLLPSSPVEQTRLIAILTHTVDDMTKEVAYSQALTYLPRLLEQAIECTDDVSSSHSAMCYASIINKLKQSDLERFADLAMSTLWEIIHSVGSDYEVRARSLTMWLWLIKALLLRSHPLGKTGALKLFELFSDDHMSSCTADGFSVILEDSEIGGLTSKSRNATISLFWRQQFFSEIVPELVARFNQSHQDERQYFLRALSHIMKSVPRQVLLEQFPLLHPLLMESLNSDQTGLSLSTLTGLEAILTATSSVISDHIPILIPRLLALATRPDSMKIRCSALSCLNTLAKLPRHLVYPYQKQVIQTIVPCLDDKKRLVRKEAVKTRSNWFVLDTV